VSRETRPPADCGSCREKDESKVPPRYSRHRRQRLPVEMELQDRCLAARCPGATAMRSFAQSAFVDEDDRAALVFGLFFNAGQRACFHRRMLSSSRSSARPTGRWQLHPNCRDGARRFIAYLPDDHITILELRILAITAHVDVGGEPDSQSRDPRSLGF